MQDSSSRASSKTPDFGLSPAFNVVIAYEDFETGKHAKRIYDFLAETLREEYRLSSQMWKFDVLRIPKLREIASADAAGADLVLISCRGEELAQHTKEWIESWVACADGPMALVALFDCPTEVAAQLESVRDYLAGAARRGNMEFFAQSDSWPDSATVPEKLTLPVTNSRNERTLGRLAGTFERDLPPAHWSGFD